MDDADRLEWAARCGAVLIDSLADRPPTDRGDIENAFASAPFALAYFSGRDFTLEQASAAWTDLFGDSHEAPPALRELIRNVAMSSSALRIDTLAFRTTADPHGLERMCRIALTAIRDGVIVACVDRTEAHIADKVGVRLPALVWSGLEPTKGDFFNAEWCAYTGLAHADMIGADWHDRVHANDRARVPVATREVTEIELRLLRHDGEYRWHRVRWWRDPDAPRRWVAAAVDIHTSRLARLELERASELKDQFFAIVSHELRSPLTTMMLWEQVLREDFGNIELRGRALDAIRESAASQSRLVADLLDVSRAISGKLHIDRRKFVVDTVLGSAVDAMIVLAATKGIQVSFEARPRLGRVLADPARLRQVFDNIMSNAVKFTPPGGKISVVATRVADLITIAIRDTGRGIAPELLPRLFEPFTQSDDALTRSEGGLGLGLAIAHRLVDLHGGTLTASSDGIERGSTFTLTLPRASRRAPSPVSGSPPALAPRLDGVRVLVIDDDEDVRSALVVLLKRVGAFVATAMNAEEARGQLASELPDAILCDIAMPGEDGYAFIRTLRDSCSLAREVPAIALTAYASVGDRTRASDAGFDAHIAKPVSVEQLATAIEQVVRHRRTDYQNP